MLFTFPSIEMSFFEMTFRRGPTPAIALSVPHQPDDASIMSSNFWIFSGRLFASVSHSPQPLPVVGKALVRRHVREVRRTVRAARKNGDRLRFQTAEIGLSPRFSRDGKRTAFQLITRIFEVQSWCIQKRKAGHNERSALGPQGTVRSDQG